MIERSMIRPGPLAFCGLAAGLAGLAALGVSAASSPGCTGPTSADPCDYLATYKTAATTKARSYSPHLPFQVLDLGSSVYVRQTADAGVVVHAPGAVIDKKSCRVCRIDDGGAYAVEDGLRVIATHPGERPRT